MLDFEATDICGQGPEVFEISRMMDLTPTHLGVLFLAYIDIDSDARYPPASTLMCMHILILYPHSINSPTHSQWLYPDE